MVGKFLKKVLPAALLFILVMSGLASAREGNVSNNIDRSAGNLEIPRGTTVDGNVSLGAGDLTVRGTVNGDVYVSLGQVSIHGAVNGDVELNTGQLLVSGSVTGNVILHIGEVVLDGFVGGDLDSGLGSAVVNGSVDGDLNSVAGKLQIAGTVGGSVNAADKSKITIEGEVGGDVILARGLVELGPDAVVNGRVFVEQGLVKIAEGASAGSYEVTDQLTEDEVERMLRSEKVVIGDIGAIIEHVVIAFQQAISNIRFLPQIRIADGWKLFTFGIGWPWLPVLGLFGMVLLFALSALTYVLFPQHVRVASRAIVQTTGSVIGWGVAALILVVPLTIFLAISIIGIPLILVVYLLLALAVIFGYTSLAAYIGGKIVGDSPSRAVGAIAVGVLLMSLVTMIPLLGILLALGIYILAVGAALSTRFGTTRPPGGPGQSNGPPTGEENPA